MPCFYSLAVMGSECRGLIRALNFARTQGTDMPWPRPHRCAGPLFNGVREAEAELPDGSSIAGPGKGQNRNQPPGAYYNADVRRYSKRRGADLQACFV